jgi:hypothetical protein
MSQLDSSAALWVRSVTVALPSYWREASSRTPTPAFQRCRTISSQSCIRALSSIRNEYTNSTSFLRYRNWILIYALNESLKIFDMEKKLLHLSEIIKLPIQDQDILFSLLFVVWWDWVHFVLRPLLAYCINPEWWMMVIVEQLVEWRLAGGTEVLGKTCPSSIFFHHKSHMTWPGR